MKSFQGLICNDDIYRLKNDSNTKVFNKNSSNKNE